MHPDTVVFGLNYTETLVLPLQGFWNALVYIITSQTACRNLWRRVFSNQPPVPRKDSYVGGGGGQGLDAPPGGKHGPVVVSGDDDGSGGATKGRNGMGMDLGMMMTKKKSAPPGDFSIGGGGGGSIIKKQKTGASRLGGKVERLVSRTENQRSGVGSGGRHLHSSESVAKLTESAR